jgi:hypothetical protein
MKGMQTLGDRKNNCEIPQHLHPPAHPSRRQFVRLISPLRRWARNTAALAKNRSTGIEKDEMRRIKGLE